MKKILFVLLLLSFGNKIFGQQFSQYNTGTLYDSFENPSQKAFITDTSKQFATNLFIPNFNANFYITGDVQATLKSRAFNSAYDNSALMINKGRLNHANVNVNAYVFMFKMFSGFNGDVELGFSAQTRGEGNSTFTDESIAAFNGIGSFPANAYSDIFNDKYYFQTYHQLSFTYREKVSKQFSFGLKLSALLGIQYQELNIYNSQITYDKPNDSAIIGLRGVYYANYIPGGRIGASDFIPNFRNPGASISLGGTYTTEDDFILQGNIKDLGFIHWATRSESYLFSSRATIEGLSASGREDNVYNAVHSIIRSGGVMGSFTTPVDGRAELSVNKKYWIDDDRTFRYSPTLIASKELFYPGFTGALVNPFQYRKFTFTLTTTYDDMKLFNLGAQIMIQQPNFEFYLGSDKVAQTGSIVRSLVSSGSQTFNNGAFSGADLFLGFSIKFGRVTEHPMNSSTMSMGEKGFFGRLFGRIFKTDE